MHINDAIQEMQIALVNEQWDIAEAKLNAIRTYIRNGGEMQPYQYDALRKGHTEIMSNLVDKTPELQPTQLIP